MTPQPRIPSWRLLLGGGAGLFALAAVLSAGIVAASMPRPSEPTAEYYDEYYYSDDIDAGGANTIGCPEGSSMVMWAEWPGGLTIVCDFGGGDYTMIVATGASVQDADDVLITPTGFFSPSLGEFGAGGRLFWPTGDGDAHVAQRWGTPTWGEYSSDATYDIAPCPSGSYAVSLSTWSGGWLLVCGTSSGSSSFQYASGSQTGSGGALTYSGGRYCGTTASGSQVCVSAAPALVTIGSGRYSADTNFFADAGPGGAGQGTGAYGVDAPAETSTDQVGYLVAILEKSAAARATVNAALAPLNACAVSAGDVTALQNLTKARTDLLAALRTTPVDQVPGGDNLLALLTRALELSEQTDQGYVDAARLMQSGDCSGGSAVYGPALALGDQAEAAKEAFVAAWNASIPSAFGVRTFSAADI